MIELKTEYPYNGKAHLIRHYAEDENGVRYKILQVNTSVKFDEAIDAYPTEMEYSVTDELIEGENVKNQG